MESINSYLTPEGWKNDWGKTKKDLTNFSKSTRKNLVLNEKGNVGAGVLAAMIATPISAYAFSYVGEGLGWVSGNIANVIPYVKDVVPWLAERSGLIQDSKNVADLNENLYQTSGAISGFYGGIFLPWRILADSLKKG